MTNTLFYGENLSYLREREPESVDLVYLDPPFNLRPLTICCSTRRKAMPYRHRPPRSRTPGPGRRARRTSHSRMLLRPAQRPATC